MSLKILFVDSIIQAALIKSNGKPIRVLDIGSGTSVYMPALLANQPLVTYVGVEPIKASYDEAVKNLAGLPNAQVHLQLGYDHIEGEALGSFDLVFSQSVLEHVKQLLPLLGLGEKYLKSGGTMVHRYDLGHSLTPHSLKEQFHVFMGNNFPDVLPERQFVRYVPESEVRVLYTQLGFMNVRATYHQMPSHKSFEKTGIPGVDAAVKELFEWESKYQSIFAQIPLPKRELLFPAVAVWGEKK